MIWFWLCLTPLSAIFQLYQAKIKNKFVSPYPTDPVKISRLKFFLLEICRHFFSFFFSFHSKFVLLKIPYFRFVSPKDRYFHITKHIFVIKKKSPYLPTSKIVGRVRGNRNIFNYGLMATSFSGGRSWSTRREPPTMGKQLVNFITYGCESSAPFFVIYKAECEPMPHWW